MTDPERIEWRRSFPSHALVLVGWYAVVAGLGVGVVWLLFGSEPSHLDNGESNPLAVIPPVSVIVAGLGALPFVLAVVRRPSLTANHYALQVRPTWLRTLVLPWARIAQVAAYRIDGEPYLLVRCGTALDRLGDRPGWVDRAVLRAADRAADTDVVNGFDLAVRMRDFTGTPRAQLTALAAFAPDHVAMVGDIESI
jgi:hypothetical protein